MKKSETFVHNKYRHLKENARRKSLEFDLTHEDIQKLLSNPVCYTCGLFCDLEPMLGGIQRDNGFSFERLNPLKGYKKGNVVCNCVSCNNKKSVHDQRLKERFKGR